MTYSATETLTIGSATATTTSADVSNGRKSVSGVGTSNSRYRTVGLSVTKGDGVSFNYAINSGRGGLVMGTGSSIIGNVYSNGSITGAGSITASAVAANSTALLKDQSNETPSTPTSSINVGNTATTQDFAQSFQITTTEAVNKISLYIKKTGTPSSATIRILKDSSGVPGTENMLTTNGTLTNTSVTTSYAWVDVTFSVNPTLYSGTTYWLVIDAPSTSSSNYYTIGANTDGYTSGSAKSGVYSGTWNATSPSNLDGYFQVYTGGLLGIINGINVGSSGTGDAWAHTITNSTVAGTKYCQSGSGCNTSRSDPTPISYPVSDADIAQWKADAEAGGTLSGNQTISSSQTLGPKKINGDLTIQGNNVYLTLTGIVWVTGNVLVNNNAVVKLDASYGSDDTIVIADGRIKVNNNGSFAGSGTAGSYVMAISLSDCPLSSSCSGNNAIDINNNAGAVVLNAQRGTVYIANNSSLAEATAETLTLGNNATVTYVTGLVDMFFSTGPSGTWDINSWKEN